MGWRRRSSRHFFPLVCCIVKNGFAEQLLVGGGGWGWCVLFWGFFVTIPGVFSACWGCASSIRGPSSPAGHHLLSSIPRPHMLPGGSDGLLGEHRGRAGGRRSWPVLAIAGGPGCHVAWDLRRPHYSSLSASPLISPF